MKPNVSEVYQIWPFFSDLARVSISSPGRGNEDSSSEIVSKLDIS